MGRLLLILIFLAGISFHTLAQGMGKNDTIMLGAIIIDNDTLPHLWLAQVDIYATRLGHYTKKQWRQEKKGMTADEILRYNVYKTYPYAVLAGFILSDVDSALSVIRSKEAKGIYKKRKETELNKAFRKDLENLTMAQGKILVKLIARQTGKDCYAIIKELKGGFNARIYQTLAILFQNDLKGKYDAQGRDADIEAIVKELEARGRYIRASK